METTKKPGLRTARRYALIWLAWTGVGLFYVTQDSLPHFYTNDLSWRETWQDFFIWMIPMWFCALLTPALLRIGRRWPIAERGRVTNILLHVAFSAAFSVVTNALETIDLRMLNLIPAIANAPSFLAGFKFLLVYGFHGGVVRYWAVIGVQAGYLAFQRATEREKEALALRARSAELAGQLAVAQLGALKAQLRPHFLFNTLEAISSMVRKGDPRATEEMIGRLSSLLRAVLEDYEEQEVSVRREFEFLRLYLSIEQARFRDRLKVEFHASDQVLDGLVPQLVLQPIVENAVRHGLGRSEEIVSIRVSAERADSDLLLKVEDDGPGSPGGFDNGGIGLANSRERLDKLYGTASRFKVRNLEPRGVEVTISLPYHSDQIGWEAQ